MVRSRDWKKEIFWRNNKNKNKKTTTKYKQRDNTASNSAHTKKKTKTNHIDSYHANGMAFYVQVLENNYLRACYLFEVKLIVCESCMLKLKLNSIVGGILNIFLPINEIKGQNIGTHFVRLPFSNGQITFHIWNIQFCCWTFKVWISNVLHHSFLVPLHKTYCPLLLQFKFRLKFSF